MEAHGRRLSLGWFPLPAIYMSLASFMQWNGPASFVTLFAWVACLVLPCLVLAQATELLSRTPLFRADELSLTRGTFSSLGAVTALIAWDSEMPAFGLHPAETYQSISGIAITLAVVTAGFLLPGLIAARREAC